MRPPARRSRRPARKAASATCRFFKRDEIKAFATFWNDIPRKDRHFPTEDATFDERYAAWLRDNSVWVPLKVMLKSQARRAGRAGYPRERGARVSRRRIKTLSQAESSSPGRVSSEPALGFLNASRALGEAVNPTKYPSDNSDRSRDSFQRNESLLAGAVRLWLGGAALASRARVWLARRQAVAPRTLRLDALPASGLRPWPSESHSKRTAFISACRISGWAPVTNMYETVIWVAMVAAVLVVHLRDDLSPAHSSHWPARRVALLGTITAANVPLLDPSIKSLQPVLRSNFWLTIHVLTEVSSYAAFGLAWMLG